MATTRTPAAILAALFCAALAAAAPADEPAYVDSPAGRSVPDPARTDRRAPRVAPAGTADYADLLRQAEELEAYERELEAQQREMEAQRAAAELVDAQRMAQAREGQGAVGAGGFAPAAHAGPPVGGRDLAAELRQAGVSLDNDPTAAADATTEASPP